MIKLAHAAAITFKKQTCSSRNNKQAKQGLQQAPPILGKMCRWLIKMPCEVHSPNATGCAYVLSMGKSRSHEIVARMRDSSPSYNRAKICAPGSSRPSKAPHLIKNTKLKLSLRAQTHKPAAGAQQMKSYV